MADNRIIRMNSHFFSGHKISNRFSSFQWFRKGSFGDIKSKKFTCFALQLRKSDCKFSKDEEDEELVAETDKNKLNRQFDVKLMFMMLQFNIEHF